MHTMWTLPEKALTYKDETILSKRRRVSGIRAGHEQTPE